MPKRRMGLSSIIRKVLFMLRELETMESLIAVLEPFSASERSRMLAWLGDYFESEGALEAAGQQAEPDVAEDELGEPLDADDVQDEEEVTIDTLEELMALVMPKTARQKVACVGWWLEERDGEESWRTYEVTKALKSIGQPLQHLSTTITHEKKRDDSMVVQVAKSGDSMQARGSYKLSELGRGFVEGRLPEGLLASGEWDEE